MIFKEQRETERKTPTLKSNFRVVQIKQWMYVTLSPEMIHTDTFFFSHPEILLSQQNAQNSS